MLCFFKKYWESSINHLDCRLGQFTNVTKKPVLSLIRSLSFSILSIDYFQKNFGFIKLLAEMLCFSFSQVPRAIYSVHLTFTENFYRILYKWNQRGSTEI